MIHIPLLFAALVEEEGGDSVDLNFLLLILLVVLVIVAIIYFVRRM